jgi:hypothetical protein
LFSSKYLAAYFSFMQTFFLSVFASVLLSLLKTEISNICRGKFQGNYMAFCGDTGVLVAAATSERGANGNLRSQRSGEEGFHPGKLTQDHPDPIPDPHLTIFVSDLQDAN